MGFFNSIVRVVPTGRKSGANVNKSAVFDTPADAHTAANPTDYHKFRWGAEVRKPRIYTQQEAMELENLVKIREQQVKSTQESFKHLAKIKGFETDINKAFYGYAGECIKENTEVMGILASHANVAITAGVAQGGMATALDSQEREAIKQLDLMQEEFSRVW